MPYLHVLNFSLITPQSNYDAQSGEQLTHASSAESRRPLIPPCGFTAWESDRKPVGTDCIRGGINMEAVSEADTWS